MHIYPWLVWVILGCFLRLSQKATSSSLAGSKFHYCWSCPNILECSKWCYLVKTLSPVWCYEETRFSFRSPGDAILVLFPISFYMQDICCGRGRVYASNLPKPCSPVSANIAPYGIPCCSSGKMEVADSCILSPETLYPVSGLFPIHFAFLVLKNLVTYGIPCYSSDKTNISSSVIPCSVIELVWNLLI